MCVPESKSVVIDKKGIKRQIMEWKEHDTWCVCVYVHLCACVYVATEKNTSSSGSTKERKKEIRKCVSKKEVLAKSACLGA